MSGRRSCVSPGSVLDMFGSIGPRAPGWVRGRIFDVVPWVRPQRSLAGDPLRAQNVVLERRGPLVTYLFVVPHHLSYVPTPVDPVQV